MRDFVAVIGPEGVAVMAGDTPAGAFRLSRGVMRAGAMAMVAALAAVLAGCGGGGGGSPAPTMRQPLPELTQDILPSGDRVDRRAENYFPAQSGDQWVYDRLQGGVATGQQYTRSFSPGPAGDLLLTEQGAGQSGSLAYRRTADGLVIVDPFASSGPDALRLALPTLLEYPEPFYPAGTTRRIVRQGTLGLDLDGDSHPDSYRFEYAQVFVGFETVVLPTGPIDNAAHFRNVTTVSIQPSDLDFQTATVTATEETWWAPGVGMVQAAYSIVDESGALLEPAYTLVLRSGTVNGQPLVLAQPDGSVRKIDLVHRALVYDALREVYYASIPASVPLQGNRIAIIDAATGAVSYSAAVGSEPAALALAADGSALYVGLDGSGDVVKLALPGFGELARTRLPSPAFYGQLRAETITVSPADADTVAVSTLRIGISPRHGGVALIRAGALQPRMTQDHTGSNLVVFDAGGSFVYGFNNETTEFGLRRIAVVADGLQEEAVVTVSDAGFGTFNLDRIPGGVLLGRALYDTPALTLRGRTGADGAGCRWHAASIRIVCRTSFSGGSDRSLTVVDPATLTTLALPRYQREYGTDDLSEIVAGPRGQVALRFNAPYYSSSASSLWLFTTPALP